MATVAHHGIVAHAHKSHHFHMGGTEEEPAN